MDAAFPKVPLIAVTGGGGWLGRRLVQALTQGLEGLDGFGAGTAPVRCLVQASERSDALQTLGVELVRGDLRDPEASRQLLRGAEGALLFHVAGMIHPPGRTRYFEDINVGGTRNLLTAAKEAGVRRMVVMSSNSPLGYNPTPDHRFTEDSPYRPYMGYGRSKWRMELMLREAMQTAGGAEIVIARAPWFYGPGQPPRQSRFFQMVRQGKFPLMGRGLNQRSLGYVDSLAYGLLLCAAVEQARGNLYWLADERPYSMVEIVDTIQKVMVEDFGLTVSNRQTRLPPVMADVARLADRTLQFLGLYQQEIHVLSEMNLTIACDIGKAKAELGYKPLVDLRQGMHNSIRWVLEQGLPL